LNIDLGKPIDISIPLKFGGVQPNAYGVAPAVADACESTGIIGDTRRGGSCNFEQTTLIPHCNGTHTECVGHITKERISIRDRLQDTFVTASLITVTPEYCDGELLIERRHLDGISADTSALIIRTLPNDDGKLSRIYDEKNMPAYFSADAMQWIVDRGYKHLLVDLPSIDRLFDDGKLANHRTFWNVDPGSFEVNAETRMASTITELIYVPDEVADGPYWLNLQIAPFESDAAPSRPLLFHRALESRL
jgi:arylformamidase